MALKIILTILLFIVLFEVGLLISYTIMTPESADVRGFIDLQINTIVDFFSSRDIDNILTKDPEQINITNKIDLVDNLSALTKLDGINIDNLNVTTYSNVDDGEITVNITGMGYSSVNTANIKSKQIILSGVPDYLIRAVATANVTSTGIVVDLNTLKIISKDYLGNSSDYESSGIIDTVNVGSSNGSMI